MSRSSSSYTTVQGTSRSNVPSSPPIFSSWSDPCGWPGTQNRDVLFQQRKQLFLPMEKSVNQDPWQQPFHGQNMEKLNRTIASLGKNVCEYRIFPKTPVLWFS